MKFHRNFARFALVPVLALVLAGCGDKPLTATETAEAFLAAMRDNDTATITNLMRPEMRAVGSGVSARMAEGIPNDAPLHVELVEEAGNTARVVGVVDLTPEQAADSLRRITRSYRSHEDTLAELLSEQAMRQLFGIEYYSGWSMIGQVIARSSPDGAPLDQYFQFGVPADTLQSWLTDPPVPDATAIAAIEEVAADLADYFERGEKINREEYQATVQELMAHLDEYLAYTHVLTTPTEGGFPTIDLSKPGYVMRLPMEFHKVEDEWLFSGR